MRDQAGHNAFQQFQLDRGVYWNNPDGSHHLSAARYQAVRLGVKVPLTGRQSRYAVDALSLTTLRRKWAMYLVPSDGVSGPFREAMKAFRCPFGISPLPDHMHTSYGDKQLKVIWLDINLPKAAVVAALLAKTGFPDFGCLMQTQLK